ERRTLEQMHRRTLTLLRREVQPVPLTSYAAFLAEWHRISSPLPLGESHGENPRLNRTLQQLRAFPVPAVALERDVLPVRNPDFDSAELAERCQAGELMWVAEGGKDPRRARVSFLFRGEGGVFLDGQPSDETLANLGQDARVVQDFLREEGAALLADLHEG